MQLGQTESKQELQVTVRNIINLNALLNCKFLFYKTQK